MIHRGVHVKEVIVYRILYGQSQADYIYKWYNEKGMPSPL